jgi:hypothetical protein
MKAAAAAARAEWATVLRSDAADRASQDWRNLVLLVKRAMPAVESALSQAKRPLLLVRPGLLARYDQLDFLERLRDSAGRPGGPPAAWVLIPSDGLQERPVMDGQPIAVITPGQWSRIPEAWLMNAHRARG